MGIVTYSINTLNDMCVRTCSPDHTTQRSRRGAGKQSHRSNQEHYASGIGPARKR